MLDTEQANAKIKQLESFIEELEYDHLKYIEKINDENRELLDKASELAKIDQDTIQKLEQENEELRQQIEALQTELNQLKNP